MGQLLKTIVFDVDGTLIYSDRNPEKINQPREDVISLMRAFNSLGWKIFVHSGGGVLYAQRWVQSLKLDEEMHITIGIKGDKQMVYDIAVDDCELEQDWTENKEGFFIKAKHYIIV